MKAEANLKGGDILNKILVTFASTPELEKALVGKSMRRQKSGFIRQAVRLLLHIENGHSPDEAYARVAGGVVDE